MITENNFLEWFTFLNGIYILQSAKGIIHTVLLKFIFKYAWIILLTWKASTRVY